MEIRYELTERDFTEAYSVHRASKTWRKWAGRIFIWIAGLFTAVLLLGLLVKPSWEVAKGLLPFFAFVTLWIGVLWFLPRRSMRRQFLHQPGAHGPRTLTLDEEGVHWKWNGGSSDVEWKNYVRFVDGKNQILFYTSPACFNIVPKRALLPAELLDLRGLLEQHIRFTR
jgi:hypothetical protein